MRAFFRPVANAVTLKPGGALSCEISCGVAAILSGFTTAVEISTCVPSPCWAIAAEAATQSKSNEIVPHLYLRMSSPRPRNGQKFLRETHSHHSHDYRVSSIGIAEPRHPPRVREARSIPIDYET